jgi:hypothetical protein
VLIAALVACAAPEPAPVASPGSPAGWPARRWPASEPPPATESVPAAPRSEPAPRELPPQAEHLLSSAEAGSPAAARVVKLLVALRDGVRGTNYQHRTEIRPADGFYGWDCSGMVSWILHRSAGRAFRALGRTRGSAADFFRLLDKVPAGDKRRGWQKLAHVSEARPGDLFVFLRSALSTSPVSGHIGFLIERPRPVPGQPLLYEARIVDSTSAPHLDDTRDGYTTTGFGFGTMLFVTDDSGETIAYGWHGTRSGGYMPTRILFGRVW